MIHFYNSDHLCNLLDNYQFYYKRSFCLRGTWIPLETAWSQVVRRPFFLCRGRAQGFMNSAIMDLRSSIEWPSFHQLQDTPSALQQKTTWVWGLCIYQITSEMMMMTCLLLCVPFLCLIVIFCVSSEFSEVVDLFTSCSVPLPPFPPELEKAGVTWLCLKWQRPTSSPKEDDIYYILEMEEEGSVCYSFLSKHFFHFYFIIESFL